MISSKVHWLFSIPNLVRESQLPQVLAHDIVLSALCSTANENIFQKKKKRKEQEIVAKMHFQFEIQPPYNNNPFTPTPISHKLELLICANDKHTIWP